MVKANKVLIRVGYPKWFRVFYGIGAPITLLLFIITGVHFSRQGFTSSELALSVLFLAILGVGVWISPVFYRSVVAKEDELQIYGLFGLKLSLTWDEIIKVSRPRFGIPRDATYLFSRNGEKVTLAKGMEGYSELLDLIQVKALNVTPKPLPPDLWPETARRMRKETLIFFGLLLAYVIAKLIFKF
ncbi:MAG: hypothetical protein ACE5HC_11980 [Candidatus Binatia bacterium]